jgi:hypothetical protein
MQASTEDHEVLMKRNPQPESEQLYHYTGRVDDDNLLRMLGGELFYFSNPKHFNDALDVKMPIQATKVGEQNPQMSIIATRPDGTTGPTNVFTDHQPALADVLSQILPELQDESALTLRVLCLTDSNVNNLMWSHYGNRHSGICLGLDWKKFTFSKTPHKVHYQQEMSLTEFNTSRFEWEVHPRARTKTPEWSYEKEWRIFSNARTSDEMVFEQLTRALKSVTLGANVTRQTQIKVIELVMRHNPQIEILQADFVNGMLQISPLKMPNNFYSVNGKKLNELFTNQLDELFQNGDIDVFIENLSPYFLWLNELDNLKPLWCAIIEAGRLTTNAVLKNRIRRWCPVEWLEKTADARYMSLKQDEFDVWQAYLSLFQKKSINFVDMSLVTDFTVEQLSDEDKQLFLSLGYKLASLVKTNPGHILGSHLQELCQSNLNLSQVLNHQPDIDSCSKMLTSLS